MSEYLVWDPALRIGVPQIDTEHKELVDIANEVLMIKNPASEIDRVRSALHRLREYTQTHFTNEEAYMSSVQYDGLAEHQTKHAAIIQDMNALLKESSGIEDLVARLSQFMKQWVLKHITEDDMKLKPPTAE